MNRLFLVLAALAAVSGLYAQKAGEISVGSRAGIFFGLHDAPNEEGWLEYKAENLRNFNFAVYAAYTVVDNFSVQAELNGMINQGFKFSGRYYEVEPYLGGYRSESVSGKWEITYSSLDIPILAKYSFINTPLLLGVQAGPHLSIHMGKLKNKISMSYTETVTGTVLFDGSSSGSYSDAVEVDTGGLCFGFTFGLYAGYPVGPGRIVGDLRFILDMNNVKVKLEDGSSSELFKRRGINFTLGYEVSF